MRRATTGPTSCTTPSTGSTRSASWSARSWPTEAPIASETGTTGSKECPARLGWAHGGQARVRRSLRHRPRARCRRRAVGRPRGPRARARPQALHRPPHRPPRREHRRALAAAASARAGRSAPPGDAPAAGQDACLRSDRARPRARARAARARPLGQQRAVPDHRPRDDRRRLRGGTLDRVRPGACGRARSRHRARDRSRSSRRPAAGRGAHDPARTGRVSRRRRRGRPGRSARGAVARSVADGGRTRGCGPRDGVAGRRTPVPAVFPGPAACRFGQGCRVIPVTDSPSRPRGTSMAKYVVLIPGNEDSWDATPQEQKERVYNAHMEFAKLLAERGHTFVEGAELVRSDQARIVSGSVDDVTITDGPYAEAAEQLTGFYVIDSDDLDDLLKCVGRLTADEGRVEVRSYASGGGM